MTENDLVTRIRQHAEPLAAHLGLVIWGIEIGGGSRTVLRVFVETPAEIPAATSGGLSVNGTDDAEQDARGVDVEHCAELSRGLGLALDVDDLFSGAWTLEVSSPGFERPFFHAGQLPPYVGREIEVTLAAPLADWPGRKKFRGVLTAAGGDQASLRLDATQRRPQEPESVDVPWSYVRKAHLVHVFADPEKPGKSKKIKSPDDKPGAAKPGQCPGGRHES